MARNLGISKDQPAMYHFISMSVKRLGRFGFSDRATVPTVGGPSVVPRGVYVV
ncbi:hypothetical protein [Isoptericola sp. BMS4]|uniref:hypothetical protein n=1 Tax=Isoptericola sp. BMS4 TaxID=2527875 RepID=UPI001422DABF|nr:hypothetical protein [Isoptericola sp. BMS4]